MRSIRTVTMLTLVGLLVLLAGCSAGQERYRGLKAFDRGSYAEARPLLEKAVSRNDADWLVHYRLGQILLAENDPVRAQSHLELALAVRGEGLPQEPETPDIIDALAEAMYQQGDYPKLMGFCDEMSRRYGTPRDHMRKGALLARMGDHDSALVAYIKAVKIAKAGDAEPYVALADFYESVGKKDDAVLMLRRAHGIEPRDLVIADRLRGHGVVPGPTAELPPIE